MRRRRQSASAPGTTHLSLERGLRLLGAVAAGGRANSLAEVSRQTGLHRSTAHHLLQALVGLGYLRQDVASRAYAPAPKLFQLSGRTWTAAQLSEIAQPFLAELTRRGGEGSSLAVYRDGIVTVVAKCEHSGPVRVVQDVGAQREFHCTAVGKAIVAWLSHTELDALLARSRYPRHTSKTITTSAAFGAELRRIRAAGYAVDDEEHLEGIRCIAMPVFDQAGQVIASMCAVGPKVRMTQLKLRALRKPLGALSAALSARLGWRGNRVQHMIPID